MKKYAIISILAVILLAGFVNAEIVQINIEAEVTSVDDSGNYLEGNINVGDTITGYYIYDTETPDSNPSESVGDYYSGGIYLSCNGLDFRTDQNNSNFKVTILNDHTGVDAYGIKSDNNLSSINGVILNRIYWGLQDIDCLYFDSTNLIDYAPDLSAGWEFNDLDITSDRNFSIRGEVTSATKVPEPSTILLFGLSSLFLKRKNK